MAVQFFENKQRYVTIKCGNWKNAVGVRWANGSSRDSHKQHLTAVRSNLFGVLGD